MNTFIPINLNITDVGEKMELISIVIPCYNEELVIEETYRRISSIFTSLIINYEIIFINDGSNDNTMEIIVNLAKRDRNVKIISLSRNFGHQIAITAGMDYAVGDAVVVIDADLQDPVEVIFQMVEKWREGYEIVYGKRIERKGETFFKKISAKFFYKLLSNLTDNNIPTDVGDFRLIDRKVLDELKRMPERSRYVRGLIAWLGFKSSFVEYVREPRYAGETKYPLIKMIKLALDAIISFSYKPLRIASICGWISSLTGFLYLIYVIYSAIFTSNTVWGWASTMAVLLFFNGIMLIVLGIIGEYIARIYEEVKGRPMYIVDKRIGIE